MALIKLTGLPHPELFEGKPQAVYIDASRVLFITRTHRQHSKVNSEQLKIEAYDDLYSGIQRLTKLMRDKMPQEIDTSAAAKWTKDIHLASHDVQEAFSAWGRAYRADDYHPGMECTEVQLACGTALEHGVMLTRVWVSETPEQIVDAIANSGRLL